LTSDRFLTMFRLGVKQTQQGPTTISYVIESTGTTEARSQGARFRSLPDSEQIQLSLPLPPKQALASERVMFSLAGDYHAQLDAYGSAVRQLHHARVSAENLMGWWSWTSYYLTITEGAAYTNALWMAQHLKKSGYDLVHIDEGYQYSRGEYSTVNAAKFPHGMRHFSREVSRLGLRFGIWVGPLEVAKESWVFEKHKEWLLHDARGYPLWFYGSRDGQQFFVLDVTNPHAQAYLRDTFKILVNEWQASYIKLDFMDLTAIEGYYYRPHTTALQAQKIALQTIRNAVGEDVYLDKDGSPMLNPVGIVDEGRISGDTKHSFTGWKESAIGIMARYYMHHNFFVADPDAFTLQEKIPATQIDADDSQRRPLTLNEAQISIALAALSGGTFEIGDDLPTLGSDPERLALLTNSDVLCMVKLGRAARPIDLLEYASEDQQPSISFLHEDDRQSILAIFNWTDGPRAHDIKLAQLGLNESHSYDLYDVFDQNRLLPVSGDTVSLAGQTPHSVKLIRIVDRSIPPAAPTVTVDAPDTAKIGQTITFITNANANGVPGLEYRWDFGDGVSAEGTRAIHTYTVAGKYNIKLTVEGLDGAFFEKAFQITVRGEAIFGPPVRYSEATGVKTTGSEKSD
jgi:alpha-galactosidase